MIFRVTSNRRVHYAASLDLRVELRRKKKRNKPCAFRKTSHDALYARDEIGGWRSADAHSGASTFFKEYRLITCAASSWRIPRISIYPFANANS